MRKKPQDILREKQAKLVELTDQAEAAVDLVTRTISGLEMVNQEIDDTVAEIDAYMSDLVKTREAMSAQRHNNAAIISNFSKLLDPEYAETGVCSEVGENAE